MKAEFRIWKYKKSEEYVSKICKEKEIMLQFLCRITLLNLQYMFWVINGAVRLIATVAPRFMGNEAIKIAEKTAILEATRKTGRAVIKNAVTHPIASAIWTGVAGGVLVSESIYPHTPGTQEDDITQVQDYPDNRMKETDPGYLEAMAEVVLQTHTYSHFMFNGESSYYNVLPIDKDGFLLLVRNPNPEAPITKLLAVQHRLADQGKDYKLPSHLVRVETQQYTDEFYEGNAFKRLDNLVKILSSKKSLNKNNSTYSNKFLTENRAYLDALALPVNIHNVLYSNNPAKEEIIKIQNEIGVKPDGDFWPISLTALQEKYWKKIK